MELAHQLQNPIQWESIQIYTRLLLHDGHLLLCDSVSFRALLNRGPT